MITIQQSERTTQTPTRDPDVSRVTYISDPVEQASVLQIRLDASDLISELIERLRGMQKVRVKIKKTGKEVWAMQDLPGVSPLMNEEGVRAVQTLLESAVNRHNFMGNLETTEYKKYISMVWRRFATVLSINLIDWEVQERNYPLIMSMFVSVLIPSMTRPIENKERESISGVASVHEVRTAQGRKKILGVI